MGELAKEIDYRKECERLRKVEKENQELKETIINMSKCMFQRDNTLTEIIKDIDKNLKRISRRK